MLRRCCNVLEDASMLQEIFAILGEILPYFNMLPYLGRCCCVEKMLQSFRRCFHVAGDFCHTRGDIAIF